MMPRQPVNNFQLTIINDGANSGRKSFLEDEENASTRITASLPEAVFLCYESLRYHQRFPK